MESNGNILRSCSSEPPLTRRRTVYATNTSNLTYVLGENEFSWSHEESGDVQYNLVSLNEQQFVDSVSQRADELKPPGHESLPHFSPNPPFLSRTESEDSKVLMSQLCFFYHRRICHRTRLLIPFPARLCAFVSSTVQQVSSLLTTQGAQVQQIIFTLGHDTSTQVRRARCLTAVG